MALGFVTDRVDLAGQRFVLITPVNIAGEGHRVSAAWSPVAGATKAEVTSARLTLLPAVAEETHTDATKRADGAGWSIDVPAKRRVRAIALVGLKQPGGNTLTSALPAGMRLTVAFPPVKGGGFDSPRFSVPAVSRDHAVPQTLTGASFSGGVLQLSPSVAAARVRVALVDGDNPSSFNDQATELTRVNLTTHSVARNAKVTGPDALVLWEVPEFDPDAAAAEIDLRHAIEAAFTTQIAAGDPLDAAFVVTADTPAEASVTFSGPAGFLVRVESGIIRTVLEGDPASPALNGPLANETPHSATGDLTIRYDGIRILETVSDALPSSTAPVSGVVVGAVPAVRTFPPHALEGWPLARIGVFGRAPEACELAIELVEATGDTVGATLAPPAVVTVAAGGSLDTHWADLPPNVVAAAAAGIRVRANSGRFFWASNDTGQPLVRVAIVDPDPGGRPLRLASATLVNVTGPESHQPAFAFPASVLRGGTPALSSDLFLTVDISDLTVRYAR